jgi:hypothetical protein
MLVFLVGAGQVRMATGDLALDRATIRSGDLVVPLDHLRQSDEQV